MAFTDKINNYFNRAISIAIALIILFGIILRFILLFQNRNLIIDEANIVRNLAERGFGGLVLPLKYEQYAPPIFLWMEKLASLLLGYGEKAMRLFPLLCGISALFVFYRIAQKLMHKAAIWFPLCLFAFGNIFIKYSVELKQYMPDTLIALLLILAALSWDFNTLARRKFVLLWIAAGSIAIWSSMPSIFLLCGVASYYSWPIIRTKKWAQMAPLILIGLVWLLQFALYYYAILKPQINSDYLQNYHRDYFLFATPANKEEWMHNWYLVENILKNIGGVTTLSIVCNLLFILLGTFLLAWKYTARFFLIAFPLGLVLIAAALKQFSLIERVVLFTMPIAMLLIGVAYDALWQLKGSLKILLLAIGIFIVHGYNDFVLFHERMTFHEITEGLDWIKTQGGKGSQLFVHDANVPTYIYYTELHPEKARYNALLGARRLKWEDNFTQVTNGYKDTAYFIYTGGFPDGERQKRTSEIERNMKQIKYFEKTICFVYVYVPKTAQDTTAAVSGTTPN